MTNQKLIIKIRKISKTARGKTEPVEEFSIGELTQKDLSLRGKEIREQVREQVEAKGWVVRSDHVDTDGNLLVYVYEPQFGVGRKKPVRRAGPQGGEIGHRVMRRRGK